jgi:hypothetical protein
MKTRILCALLLIATSIHVNCARSEQPQSRTGQSKTELQVVRLGKWLFGRTRNFQLWIIGSEAELRQLAELCEQHRATLQQKWSNGVQPAWTPLCDVVVYPRTADFVHALGPGARGSSGVSSIDMDQGRILKRKIEIRGDATNWQREVLPHELTHVVLADLFSTQRIPPWADEGVAMLAESDQRLALRRNDLNRALQRGQFLHVRQVFGASEATPGVQRSAFYSESVSLAAFLMRRGGSQKLIEFVRTAQRDGYERAARTCYGFASLSQLEQQWYADMVRNTDVVAAGP